MKLFSTLFLLLALSIAAQAANFTVNTDSDTENNSCSVGLCTLREAITSANTNAQPDLILFDPAFFNQSRTITLVRGQIQFDADAGNLTTISNTTGFPIIITGNNAARVFVVAAGANVALNALNITGGNGNGGTGGGIFNNSILMITNSAIYGNTAPSQAIGGGITNGFNVATMLTVTNSTISGNSAGNGGGISNTGGTVNLTGVTIAGNTAYDGNGGGIASANGTVNIRNSIVASNTATTANANVFGAFTSTGYNLIGNGTGGTGFTGTADQVGTAGTPINPRINTLGFYGGVTQTHALMANSPAIDKGNSFGLTTDQRGLLRPVDLAPANAADGADIGAYELQGATAAGVTVSGRVMTPTGKALSRTTVIMTDMAGVVRTASTDRRGNFVFADVRAGEAYIFEVRSKLYHFNSQAVTITEDLEGLNFTATQ